MPIDPAALKADILAKATADRPALLQAWTEGDDAAIARAWNEPRPGEVSVANERDAVDMVIEAIAPDLGIDTAALADVACQRIQAKAAMVGLLLQGDPRKPRTQAALFVHLSAVQRTAITSRLNRTGSWGEAPALGGGPGTIITHEDVARARRA